jgi:hypothetical protein
VNTQASRIALFSGMPFLADGRDLWLNGGRAVYILDRSEKAPDMLWFQQLRVFEILMESVLASRSLEGGV